MVAPGQLLTLEVEKPAAGGRMLARHAGQVVLVWGAIPGERIVARVERAAQDVIYADTVDVLTPSADRRERPGDWRCGGQVLSHIAYARQRRIKSEIIADAFRRIARHPLPAAPTVVASREDGYRMRARLHARRDRLGLVRKKSPGADPRRFLPLAAGLTGLSVSWVDSPETQLLAGTPIVGDTLRARADDPGTAFRLRRSVRAFFQGNRFLLELLMRHVCALVPAGQVVDLYAGVGLFGLALAASGAGGVTLVEGDATFIVDPPRTGVSRAATRVLLQLAPPRIVYVSCDVATLARDTRALLDGGYELDQISGLDLFPNTAHVETVVCFLRRGR
jgi:tRNA/tmRNA/rRNA uracil-C5-methylase (TrmA/RlmC/RlmD family)